MSEIAILSPTSKVIPASAAVSLLSLQADKVMRMPETSFIHRKCISCGEEKLHQKPLGSFILKKATTGSNTANDTITNEIQSSRGNGSPIPETTKTFMESRFGADFSNVKIHSDKGAAQMNKELNAQAFTVGRDLYFNENKYAPQTDKGKHLLAHELTHVMQQSNFNIKPHIARFTDTSHHIIEEAALAGGGFTEEQRKQIESGNIKRDYSQLPTIANAVLLCNPQKFGGYKAVEHFDNYIWNKEKNEWQDRDLADAKGAGLARPGIRGSDPIDYIMNEFIALVNLGLTKTGLERLGNAFHAIEDFFAHTNFIELINKDDPSKKDLLSGSVPGSTATSLAHVAEDVSSPDSAAYYRNIGEESKKEAPLLSHANIAKDHPGDRNHFQARQLAALVVQELSREILLLLKSPESERMQLLESNVFTKLRRYFQLPSSSRDAWWTKLIAADNGAIDRLLEKAERETPATVNQCVLSPLRNLEASKDSNMKIILGAAMPVKLFGANAFIQVGGGLITPLHLDDTTITSDKNDKPAAFAGAQLTGHF